MEPLGLRETALISVATHTPDRRLVPVAASMWIRADETGTIREGFLQTADGWRRLSDSYLEALNQEPGIEPHTEGGTATACWYFRPLGQRGSG